MTHYHAVMNFFGEEFPASVEAETLEEAYEKLRENYPESTCVQLESPEDTEAREKRIYDAAVFDEDGYEEEPYWSLEGYDSLEDYEADMCLN